MTTHTLLTEGPNPLGEVKPELCAHTHTAMNEETPGLGELRTVDTEANQTQSAVVSRPQSLDLCIKSELVCVEFHHAIRREENFESAEDLKAALQNDEEVSRDTFKQLFEHQRRSTKSILGQ